MIRWTNVALKSPRAGADGSDMDVSLLDFFMPGLTGLEVAAAIRARGCTTPIVMISGCASADDERQAVDAGLRFMCKPVTFAQFGAALAAVGKPPVPAL